MLYRTSTTSSAQRLHSPPVSSAQTLSYTHIPQPIKTAAPTAHKVCSVDAIFIPASLLPGPDGVAVTTIVTSGGFEVGEAKVVEAMVVVVNELEEADELDDVDADLEGDVERELEIEEEKEEDPVLVVGKEV